MNTNFTADGQSLSIKQPNSSDMESVGQPSAGTSQQVEGLFKPPPGPECEPKSKIGNAVSVALLNPANQLKIYGGLDKLMMFSTKAPFPSGIPVFLLPDSPFGADTNTFDLHARQSYLGANFSGPDLGAFQTGGQVFTFLQTDNLSSDDYRQTDYTQFQPNAFLDSDAVLIATRFLWL